MRHQIRSTLAANLQGSDQNIVNAMSRVLAPIVVIEIKHHLWDSAISDIVGLMNSSDDVTKKALLQCLTMICEQSVFSTRILNFIPFNTI